MIQNLIEALIARLQANLEGVTLQESPAPPGSLPALALYPGKLVLQQALREQPPPPRAQTSTEEFKLKSGAGKAGPYALAYLAVSGSVRASLRKTGVPPIALAEGADFTVDYGASTISFPGGKTSGGNQVSVEYGYIEVKILREFAQDLFIDVHAATAKDCEKWASLAGNILLSSEKDLVEAFNQGQSTYRSGRFTTVHTLYQVQWMEGAPGPTEKGWMYRLKFNASGDLRLIRQLGEGAETIREVIIEHHIH
jgi:hypothetical protein